jgi:hypothetical protein
MTNLPAYQVLTGCLEVPIKYPIPEKLQDKLILLAVLKYSPAIFG